MNKLATQLVLACTVVCATGMVAATVMVALAPPALAQAKPEFKLGFKALADQIPTIVGEPLESEHWGANGDSLQQTTKGLMVWRKTDNWTAFTNGSRTWINGPRGVQDRANDVRFEWESPAATATPTRVESYAPFAKSWGRHGLTLTINEAGIGSASWRTYNWCEGDDTLPCDRVDQDEIISGGHGEILLTQINGATASGQVVYSNDPQVLHQGPVKLTLLPYDMARMDVADGSTILCGPRFGDEAPDDVIQGSPCGA